MKTTPIFLSTLLKSIDFAFTDSMYGDDKNVFPTDLSFDKSGFVQIYKTGQAVMPIKIPVEHPRMAFMKMLRCFKYQDHFVGYDKGNVEYGTIYGHNFKLGLNSVIGGEGFGIQADENGIPLRIPHFSNVIIGDNVEVGNMTNIDRGIVTPTMIGNNVFIDSHVHIAHHVVIKDNTLVVAGTTICGSAEIGSNVWLGAGCTIKQRVKIGNGAYVGAGAVVIRDVEENSVVVGNPARHLRYKES